MASGDTNGIWFPEIITILRTDWHASMSWEEIIQFRDRLDEKSQESRKNRNIQPAMMWCPKCQTRHRFAPPKVSARAIILALGRFNIEEEDIFKGIKKWKAHQVKTKLDLWGKKKNSITKQIQPIR